jgi:hypothetical protein
MSTVSGSVFSKSRIAPIGIALATAVPLPAAVGPASGFNFTLLPSVDFTVRNRSSRSSEAKVRLSIFSGFFDLLDYVNRHWPSS